MAPKLSLKRRCLREIPRHHAYEDYATLDHLSGGRLELIIGKGNGEAQRTLFNVTPEDQWDRNEESYELFRIPGKVRELDCVIGAL